LRYKLQGELVETLTNIIGMRGINVLRKKIAAECWPTHGYHTLPQTKECHFVGRVNLHQLSSYLVRRRAVFASLAVCLCRRAEEPNFSSFCVVLLANQKGFSGERASKLVEFCRADHTVCKQRLQGESITTRPEDFVPLRTAQKPA
jgi:hypothetical protein